MRHPVHEHSTGQLKDSPIPPLRHTVLSGRLRRGHLHSDSGGVQEGSEVLAVELASSIETDRLDAVSCDVMFAFGLSLVCLEGSLRLGPGTQSSDPYVVAEV